MIIIGYQGIGKSHLSKHPVNGGRFIDLESGLFKDENGRRPKNWVEIYCRIALSLSGQGYTVMISSHMEVQDRLVGCEEPVVAVFPSLRLKNYWIYRLRKRWENDRTTKNEIAYLDANANYDSEIKHLMHSGFKTYEIDRENEFLEDVCKRL